MTGIKSKRGSLQKCDVTMTANPYVSEKGSAAFKLTIYTKTSYEVIIYHKHNQVNILPPEVLLLILLEPPMASYLDIR